ncbi:MAG: hypothetical protein AB1782_08885 [Cyanobacteriota bacterium]
MKPEQITIFNDLTIKDALKLFEDKKADNALVINQLKEKLGILKIENLYKAKDHNLLNYPINIIIDYFDYDLGNRISTNPENIKSQMETLLPESIKGAIHTCSEFTGEKQYKAYLVGGLVRDLFRNEQNLDVDVTVEANGIEFAEKFSNEVEEIILKEKHPDFGTAKIIYKLDNEQVEIDIASTRKEIYKNPGALPTVNEIACSLENDLFRRDFTVNAMAIDIHPDRYANLTDLYAGLVDISYRKLRLMHSYSFIDDPTRIIRGIKFATRFNYSFTPAVEKLIESCINSGLFDNYCCDRLKLELKPALNLNNIKVIKYIEDFQLYRMLDNTIHWGKNYFSLFENLKNNINITCKYINKEKIWLIYLGAILHELPHEKIEIVLEKLNLSNNEKEIIHKGIELLYLTAEAIVPQYPSDVYYFYEGYEPESIVLSTLWQLDRAIFCNVWNYFERYSNVKIAINGNDLKELGIEPGPLYSEIMEILLDLKLDGVINNKVDELAFVNYTYLGQ